MALPIYSTISTLAFILSNHLCIGYVRALMQHIHALLGQVQGEGVVFPICGLVSETLHHLDQFDDVRTVTHSRQSF